MVTCPICNKELKQLHGSHIKKHDISTEEFKKQYPNISLRNEAAYLVISSKEKIKRIHICQECGKDFQPSYKQGKYCTHSCSALASNRNRPPRSEESRRKTSESLLSRSAKILKEKGVPSEKVQVCDSYRKKGRRFKNKPIIFCPTCGRKSDECRKADSCRSFRVIPSLIKYFGFDGSKLRSEKAIEEFERIKNLVIEDYIDKEMSLTEMVVKYNHYDVRNFAKILHSIGIKIRTLGESQFSFFKMGKIKKEGGGSKQFKCGWHKTWEGKTIFYRSSYELAKCQEYDLTKINYTVEELRIVYWDSKRLKQRIAIPDFYLKDKNLIVEIKSAFTYDSANMKDKAVEYKRHGYDFLLIVDGKEFNYDNIPNNFKQFTIKDFK